MKGGKKIGAFAALVLLVASIVLLVSSLSMSHRPGDTSAAARRVSRVLNRRMATLDTYAAAAAAGDCSEWIDAEGLPDDMVIYRYCSDTLQSWANQFPVSNEDLTMRSYVPFISSWGTIESPLLEVTDSISFIYTGSSWYLAKSISGDNCRVIAGLQVMGTEERSGESNFNRHLHLLDNFTIQTLDQTGGSEVMVEGRPMFKIMHESLEGRESADATFMWAAVLVLMAAAFVYLRSGVSLRRFWICSAVVGAALLAVYIWGRAVQNQFEIFSPSIFAGDDVLYSLGAVFIVNLGFFIFSLFAYVTRVEICRSLTGRKSEHVMPIVLSAVMLGILAYAFFALRSILRNSSISLELYKFADLEVFSILVYLSFMVLLMSIPLLLELLQDMLGKRWKVSLMSGLGRVAYCIAVALYLVFTTSVLSFQKETNRTRVWSNRLLLNRDMQFEMQLRIIENSIAEDMSIAALAELDNSANSIRSRISDYYLSRNQQYTVSVYVYNDLNRTSESTAQYNFIINGGTPIADSSRFLYIDNGGSYSYYAGVFLYFTGSGTSFSRVLVKIEPKASGSNRGFGGIFGFNPPGKFSLPDGYSYGRYEGRELTSYSGNFAYPTSLDEQRFLQVYEARSGISRTEGYVHFSNVVSDNEAVIISRKTVGTFSYAVATISVAIVAFFLLCLLGIGRKRENQLFGQGYFKKRIAIVLFASLTISMVALAVVSIVFVYTRNESNLRDKMSDRINVISTMMNSGMREVSSFDEIDVQAVHRLLERVGTSTNSDITLYSSSGKVMMSTTPMVFDRMMLGGRLDGTAYDQIIYRHHRYYIQKEHRGQRVFHCMYAPVIGSNGSIVAILSAPYSEETYDFQADAIQHTITILSLFFLLLMVAHLLVSRVVDRMFRPLSEMSAKMNAADIGSLEYITYDRKDEISSLVDAYNRMVTELSESSRKLALAERDKAWSSMARQVAHEIKNPLTPMKLKLQGVIRLKQNGNPAWQERFDEASTVILDHIDILTETANEFSTFAKLYTEEPTSINLDKVLEEEIAMFDNKDNIHFDYYGLRDVVIEGPKPQLTRVFVNLINNSVQAIGESEGGRILVSLRKSSDDAFYDIVFEDNGPGVSPENIEKLFTPNFTTKNGGSGLGLAISRSVLERCGASIAYSKSFGLGGACFTIKYPK